MTSYTVLMLRKPGLFISLQVVDSALSNILSHLAPPCPPRPPLPLVPHLCTTCRLQYVLLTRYLHAEHSPFLMTPPTSLNIREC